MKRNDRLLLLGLAALVAGVSMLPAVGVSSDVMLAAPALALVLPLLAGRYLGEEKLARLAAVFAPARQAARTARRHWAPAVRRVPSVAVPRGGALIAASLANRPPPVRA